MRHCFLLPALLLFSLLSSVHAADPIQLSDEVREKCLSVLRTGLASEEFWPSMHAAEALTLAGYGEEVLTAVTPKLETVEDDQFRCGLARELVRAGQLDKRQIMFEILAGEDPHGHTHACESLYKVGELGDGNLLRKAMADTTKPVQQQMAAAALAKGGNLDVFKLIRGNLNHEDPNVARISAWILARLGDASDIPKLKEIRNKQTDPQMECYYDHALAMLGDQEGRQATLENLSHSDPFVRTYASVFAGEAGMTEAQPALEKILNDDDPAAFDARIRAAQALLLLSQPAPFDRKEIIVRDAFPTSEKNPRISEGSIIQLNNGNLLFATTEFIDSNSDYAKAHIVAKESADGGRTWGEQRLLQKNIGGKNVMSVTLRRLAHETEGSAPIGFFYLIKNDYNDLKVYLRISSDEGKTFGEQILVTDSDRYHVMNNDRVTLLSSGRLIVPVASTKDSMSENHYVCHCYYSDDQGQTWKAGSGHVDAPKRGAMEPEVFETKNGRLGMIIRNQLGYIGIAYSEDEGETWSEHEDWGVKSPEAPATLRRIPATGDLLLIWNNTYQAGAGHGGKRTPLTAAISQDDGKTWTHLKNLETRTDNTYAYTSLTFTQGRAVMSYYVEDTKTRRYLSRFRSVPVSWFYE